MHKFRKLKVWTRATEFITHVYSVTVAYPKYELYEVVDQIRRAAVAIALNIAEGSGAGSDKEFARVPLCVYPCAQCTKLLPV